MLSVSRKAHFIDQDDKANLKAMIWLFLHFEGTQAAYSSGWLIEIATKAKLTRSSPGTSKDSTNPITGKHGYYCSLTTYNADAVTKQRVQST